MSEYYPTYILKMLFRNGKLGSRLKYLFGNNAGKVKDFLKKIYNYEDIIDPDIIDFAIPKLLDYGLISETPIKTKYVKTSLRAVDVINFELTYRCDSNCKHCLQTNIRKSSQDELSTEEVKEIIEQAWVAGLV